MNKKILSVIVLTMMLMLLIVNTALAAPVGGCPPGFELHEYMDHSEHPEHHVGVKVDLNGDGYICVKHVSETRHVHVDNKIPLE